MLYINDQMINLGQVKEYKGPDPLLSFLAKKYKEVKRHPSQTFVFKYREGVVKRNKAKGLIEAKKLYIRMMAHINSDRGPEFWACTNNYSRNPNTGKVKVANKHILFNRTLNLDKDMDLDKILYLLCAATPLQGNNPMIVLENLEADAETKFNSGMESAELRLMIRDMNTVALQKIAMSIGIPNPKSLSDMALRNDVFNRAEFLIAKKEKSYEDFLNMDEPGGSMKILAHIQEGVDRSVIAFSERLKAYCWLGDGEKVEDVLLNIPPGRYGSKADVLAEYLRQNNEAYSTLVTRIKASRQEKELSGGKDMTVDTDNDPAVLDEELYETPEGEMTIKQIKEFAQKEGDLPFVVQDQALNKIAKALDIPLAKGTRKRTDVYSDIEARLKG